MNFLDHWDIRIDANKQLFDEKPGIANFAYDEAHLAFTAGRESMKAEILRGLASEDDTIQRRAIEASVAALDA